MKFGRGSRRSIRYSIFIGVLAGSVFSGSGAIAADPIPLSSISAQFVSGTVSLTAGETYNAGLPTGDGFLGEGSTYFGNFSGTFAGNGAKITGLLAPLFNVLSHAEVTNLDLESTAPISPTEIVYSIPLGTYVEQSKNNVGLLTNEASESLINSISGTGNISGGNNVGGLIGSATNSIITDSSFSGTVTGDANNIGGLVGYADNSIISGSNSNAAVNGIALIGGLVGHSYGTAISTSHAGGAVVGTGSEVGGLVGKNEKQGTTDSTINQSFATGQVTGSGNVGGLVGKNIESTITESFASGAQVSGTDHVGGLVGRTSGNISNSYATGNVRATSSTVGGLVGHTDPITPIGLISNSYATGNVTGGSYETGGFIGYNYFNIINSYSTGSVTGGHQDGTYFISDFISGLGGGIIENSFASGSICPKADLMGSICDITDELTLDSYKFNPLLEFPDNTLEVLTTPGSPGVNKWNVSCLNSGNPYLVSLASSYESTCLNTGKKSEYKKIDREPREVSEVRSTGTIEKSLGFKIQGTLPKDSGISFVLETVKIDPARIKAVEIAPTANVKVSAKAGGVLQVSLKSESKEPVELWMKSPDGNWLLAGVITFDKDGRAVLPPLQFKNAGDYSLVLSKPSADSAKGGAPLDQAGSLLVVVS